MAQVSLAYKADRRDGRVIRAERRRIERRAAILRAAESVFATRGYHAASVDHVIKAAGVSRGTFYLYFEGKSHVFLELLDSFSSRLMAAIEVVDASAPDAWLRVLTNLQRVVRLLVENRALSAVLFRSAVGLDANVDERLDRLHDHWRNMLIGALENGAERGMVRPVNAYLVATALIGSIKETLVEALVKSDRTVNIDELARALMELHLSGLRPR